MSAGTSTPAAVSARALARRRRHESWRRGWATFRQHRVGMVGLGILVVFTAIALLAPLIGQ